MAQRDSGYERKPRDAYMTPAWVTDLLAAWLEAHVFADRADARFVHIWEPAAGTGQMVDRLRHAGFRVTASDIAPHPGLDAEFDFLSLRNPPVDLGTVDAIVTNPPYNHAEEFVRDALQRMTSTGVVAMLLPLAWDTAKTRRDLFADCPQFRAQLVLTSRIKWFDLPPEPGKRKQGPSENHAWFVWDHNWCGRAEKHWLAKPVAARARKLKVIA